MPVQPAAVVRNDALRFEGVSKRFDTHVAVRELDLAVPRGAVYGLLGPNGAGKTTSIRMLMGILAPDEGRIFALGEPAGAATRDRLGYLPEERGLYPSMRVLDNLAHFGALRGLPVGEARTRGIDWLTKLGLRSDAGRRLQALSKGNQQKVQLAATLLHEPELVVLDEPFSGLDPVNQDRMRQTILALAENGTTVVLSTHLMDEVERLCSHLTLIHQGGVVAQGTLEEVKREHGTETVTVLVEGEAAAVEEHAGVVACQRRGRELTLRLAADLDPSRFLADVAAQVSVKRFEVQAASLHSIFVKLVGGRELEDAAHRVHATEGAE